MPPPGGVTVSADGSLVISSQICPMLVQVPGVPGADYRPGVAVNGKPVAPADLPGAASPVTADNFPIEIDKDLAGKFGVPATGGAYDAKAIVGYVSVRGNRAYFNGKPLDADQNAALLAACRATRPTR